jgi:5-methylcytosine-specific restriction protein A
MITPESIIDLSKKHYVRKALHSRDYWVDFSQGKLNKYLETGESFNIIIYSELNDSEHFYIIPFHILKPVLVDQYMTRDKLNRKRWIGNIIDHKIKFSNYPESMDITSYYMVSTEVLSGSANAPYQSPALVKTWIDVLDNLREFSLIDSRNPSFALDVFTAFSNWYYFPKDNLFAPGKFLGYKGTSLSGYAGHGDGAQAKRALSSFFKPVPKESNLFSDLKSKLVSFANNLEKTINSQTFYGSAGIFVPKAEYINAFIPYSQRRFNVSHSDIESFNAEHYIGQEGGDKKERLVSYYERDPKLRSRAIEIHGTICKICEFDFKAKYGSHGEDYIEVHHKRALHTLVESSQIDPEHDMTVLCANCHRMVHRKKYFPLSIEELKEIWKKFNPKENSI